MRKLSIGVRLTLWYLVIFAGAQIVFGAGMWFILRAHLYDLVDDGLESQIEDTEGELTKAIKESALWRAQDELLQSVPGIGPVNSFALILKLPELGTLNRGKIAATGKPLRLPVPVAWQPWKWRNSSKIRGTEPSEVTFVSPPPYRSNLPRPAVMFTV